MLPKMFASRGFLSVGLVLVLALAVVVGWKLSRPTPQMRSYCALMPDAIGLFVGSDVQIMGVAVGQVTKVEPDGPKARVEFDIPAARKLPPDVGATTLSQSLIADRKLALVGTEPAGPGWNSDQCITKTLTPKSMSQTFTALADLADQLNGSGDPAQQKLLQGGIIAVNNAVAGDGKRFNDLVKNLSAALNSPDAAIGHIGALIDSLAALVGSAAVNWPEVKSTLTRLGRNLDNITDTIAPPIVDVITRLVDVFPFLNDLTTMFGGPILRRVDTIPNLPQRISAGVTELRQVVDLVPPILSAFQRSIDPGSGRVSIDYASPMVAIPESAAAQVCSAVNAITPGRCADAANGLVDLPLTQFVLGSVGSR
ncbi:MlaD family protein [Nocardia sp. NPDC059228]|uniref:MlaD family protein n=1 Tax=Nocardia sp. NPDC059228 TaxID=3346777 RepID=UPI0036998B47